MMCRDLCPSLVLRLKGGEWELAVVVGEFLHVKLTFSCQISNQAILAEYVKIMGLNGVQGVCMNSVFNIEARKEDAFGYVAAAIYGVGNGTGYTSLVTRATLSFLQNLGIVNHEKRLIISKIIREDGGKLSDSPEPMVALLQNEPVLVGAEHITWENMKSFYSESERDVFFHGQLLINVLAEIGFKRIDKPLLNVVLPIAHGDVYQD